MKLERAEIAHLRGIPGNWPALPIGERGLIVYGPNGVGKSSIIDALEATIRGQSSLFKENRAEGVNWSDASPHIKGGGLPSCTIHGKINGKAVSVTMGRSDSDPDLTDWLHAASEASFVLRRYMLLQFIEAQPAERYQQIEPFLNLSSFSAFELGLKELLDRFNTQLAAANAEASAVAQVVRQTFGLSKEAVLTRASLTDLLRETLTTASISGTDVSDLPNLNHLLDSELGGHAANQKLASLGAIKQKAQQLTSASILRPLYDQVVSAAESLAQEIKTATQKVSVDLLITAREHVAAESPNICPICEQKVDTERLLERLDHRIRENESVLQATCTLVQRVNSLTKAADKAHAAYSSFRSAWEPLGLGPLPSCYNDAGTLFEKLARLTTTTAANDRGSVDAMFGSAECDPNAEIIKIDTEIRAMGGAERRALLNDLADRVAALIDKGSVAKLEACQKEAIGLSRKSSLAAKLHAHAEAARKKAVQKNADKITTLANTYYELVHPNENIATAKLTVRPLVSGSLNLTTTFYGSDAPPLKYYSESHLDTLGLCFFLSIRALEVVGAPGFKLLLIDDVLHSVDADHRARLAKLLKDHFADHQIVLVTHDKNFYERLRGTLGTGGYKYLSISSWDIDSGPHLSDPSTDLDRVIDRSKRAGMSHDDIAAAGGRLFEWLLKDLTEHLQIAIVARFTHPHDIGSMWPPTAAKLDKHKGFSAAHPGLVKRLSDNAWVRNKIGAHHNEQESPVTPKEVEDFVSVLADFYKATTCQVEKCGTTIQISKDNRDIWRCGCSKTQYANEKC